mmetsp:Transcript_4556/g.10219  ORF Transcript_4556/g.10219 Transcript_4556/m.10219 type:complete len:858 (+) Transcript_4556:626-3199(+)
MSPSSGAGDDSDLDSPLLSGEEDETRGGVTLHGETINVGDLFISSRAQGTDGRCSSSAEEQLTSLSMDNQSSSNNGAPPPSKMAYVKQTLLFLPRKGRVLYYNARHQFVRLMGARSTRDGGGLTPVSSLRSRPSSLRRSSNAITQRSALFKSTTVPLLFRLLLPLLIIANHVIFYQAQTLPMWSLTYKTNIKISGTARTLKAKAAFDALNLPHEYSFESHEEKVVETFTYWDAIRKLWEGEGLGDAQTISKVAAVLLVVFSGIWPHLKLLLVHVCWFLPFMHGIKIDESKGGCNCCRPDPKRCTLCCSNGHAHQSYNRRSPFLRILSSLGKWSLADVLVVCILIAVLHLDWEVDPSAIRAGVENELPVLLDYAKQKFPNAVQDCAQLLHYTCGKHAKVIHLPACLTCQGLVNNAYSHPEWTTGEGKDILEGINLQGGGHAQLRVMGETGTYYFCGAVIMSILISVAVDLLDQKDRQVVEEELLDRKRELEYINSNERENGLELQDERSDPMLNEALLSDAGNSNSRAKRTNRYASEKARNGITYAQASDFESHIPTATTNCRLLKQVVLVMLALASLPLVCYSVTLPTMERLVYGGGPQLLHEVLGMRWEKEYSLTTLVKTTGDAGGWDTFLMVTFGLFAVVGPILRSACLILYALLGVPLAVLGEIIERPRQRTALRVVLFRLCSLLRNGLVIAIDSLGAFVCWEVLMVALVMIQLEMPSITDTIYEDDRCEEADPEHGTTCIEVQFNATDSFFVVGIAWAVLVLASGFAMDLAAQASEDSSPVVAGQERDRYEYGRPIPHKRSNNSVIDALAAATGSEDDVKGEGEYFSPLQQNLSEGNDGAENHRDDLEQIVFV